LGEKENGNQTDPTDPKGLMRPEKWLRGPNKGQKKGPKNPHPRIPVSPIFKLADTTSKPV